MTENVTAVRRTYVIGGKKKMRRKILEGILAMAFVLLTGCGTENREDVVSLEPHSLEASDVAGVIDSRESNGAAVGMNGGADSTASDANEGAGNAVAGTGGASSTGKENDMAENGTGSTENGSDVRTSNTGTESGQDALASSVNAGARTVAESLSDTNRGIYLQAVNESESDTYTYSLIYLDADDIPELVIHDNYYEEYSIYTIKRGKLFCMVDSLATVELTYYEKIGIIVMFDRWNGGGDTGGYGRHFYQTTGDQTFTRDDQTDENRYILSYSYNATYNEKGEYMNTGVTEYFHTGQEIAEAAYYEKLTNLGITEGEDRLCMENSCRKEEIIALLNL